MSASERDREKARNSMPLGYYSLLGTDIDTGEVYTMKDAVLWDRVAAALAAARLEGVKAMQKVAGAICDADEAESMKLAGAHKWHDGPSAARRCGTEIRNADADSIAREVK